MVFVEIHSADQDMDMIFSVGEILEFPQHKLSDLEAELATVKEFVFKSKKFQATSRQPNFSKI